MSKTAKEKATEWHCNENTVRNYCLSGIIPSAFKEGRPAKWKIPDNWCKPPLGRRGLCFLLDTICQLKHGVEYSAIKFGYSEDIVKQGYDYLISCAFMSTINVNLLSKELKNAVVTPRGEALIQREYAESKQRLSLKARISAKANIGLASFEVGLEASNE